MTTSSSYVSFHYITIDPGNSLLEMETKYFTPNEVLLHNNLDDLWVSLLGRVYDLTSLCKQYKENDLLKPILAFAGKDISHWFNEKTGDLQTHVDKESGLIRPYLPHGPFIHAPPPFPSNNWITSFDKPWWKDEQYVIGFLSKKVRKVRFINMLTTDECTLEVCSEETLRQILDRYLVFNPHAESYTWKSDGRILNMNLTLDENGIFDDAPRFEEVSMNDDFYYPSILLYFNDDLTEL